MRGRLVPKRVVGGLVVGLGVAGLGASCGDKQRSSNAPSTAPAPSPSPSVEREDDGPLCASTAAKYYAPSLARHRGTQQQELFELQRDAMIDSCRASSWSADSRRCFAERTIENNTCMERLTPAQRDDWRARATAATRAFEAP